jgi:hypothetical protein
VGESCSIYLRAQNAVCHVERTSSTKAFVACWEVQAPKADVMGDQLDLRCDIPRAAMKVSWKTIEQIACAELLCDLANVERRQALPLASKAGHTFQETRDVTNPMFVDMLLASLGGEACRKGRFVGLEKKIRDEIPYKTGALPWRRTPIWVVLKSALHLMCVRTGQQDGEFVFKLVIGKFLCFVLRLVAGDILENCYRWTQSSVREAERKLLRRWEKVRKRHAKQLMKSRSCDGVDNVLQNGRRRREREISRLGSTVKTYLEDTVNQHTSPLQEDSWSVACEKQPSTELDPSNIKPDSHVKHKLTSSGPFLEQLRRDCHRGDENAEPSSESSESLSISDFPLPKDIRLAATKDTFGFPFDRVFVESLKGAQEQKDPQSVLRLFFQLEKNARSEFAIAFQQFECKVYKPPRSQILLTSTDSERDTVARLMKETLTVYMAAGKEQFKDYPRGQSSVRLTSLTLVLLADMAACKSHPLLKSYRLEIPPEFLQDLLLGTREEKQHLHKVERYIELRNSAYNLAMTGFAAKFAQRDGGMQRVLREIQDECQKSQAEKIDEKKRRQEEHDRLKNEARSLNCECWGPLSRCRRCVCERDAASISM